MKRLAVVSLALGALFLALPATAQKIYDKTPAKGALRYGEKALVDNGRCPKGQIQEITGGHMPSRGTRHGTASIKREKRCVPRP